MDVHNSAPGDFLQRVPLGTADSNMVPGVEDFRSGSDSDEDLWLPQTSSPHRQVLLHSNGPRPALTSTHRLAELAPPGSPSSTNAASSPPLTPEDASAQADVLPRWPSPPPSSPTAGATRPRGEHYEGAMLDGQRHGEGSLLVDGHLVYRGGWSHGRKHGFGREELPGLLYEGEWQGGSRHGQGTETTVHDTYSGAFVSGQREGEGTSSGRGGTYIGQWHCGRRHGTGREERADQEVYEGTWQDGHRHGSGVATAPDGTRYEGSWQHGGRHGEGQERLADGTQYTGRWAEDRRRGHGRETRPDGTIYEGSWEDGAKHGAGRQWKDGQYTFEGCWRAGFRHGYGTETWSGDQRPAGSTLTARGAGRYEGQWELDKRHGFGRWKGPLPSGSTFISDGQWTNDKFVAPDRKAQAYVRRR